MHINDRINALRKEMKHANLDAFIIQGTDPHQSEYVADRWKTRYWLSGFSGSAGTLVITQHIAGLWTDYRYYIQAAEQIKDSEIVLFKLGTPQVPNHISWICDNLAKGSKIGIASDALTITAWRDMQKAFDLVDMLCISSEDLVDNIWEDRPEYPQGTIWEVPESIAGLSRKEKLSLIKANLTAVKADATIISSLDDIAWALNLRGNDIAYNPLFLAYLFISHDTIILFCDAGKFTSSLLHEVQKDLYILPYNDVFNYINQNFSSESTIKLSPDKTSRQLWDSLPEGAKVLESPDSTLLMKSCKNPIEIQGMQKAHILDGASLVSFLSYLEDTKPEFDEITLADTLHSFRAQREEFLGDSFSPISAYKDHGALCHYSANQTTKASIKMPGLLVLDTGGQYMGGTTDITRTLVFGEATDEEKRDYTLVLKGHLALGRQKFPSGTCGYQLDILARKPIWDAGIDYGHGTGHGVGFMLNVHEGPQNISFKPIQEPLRIGMVISNEPGIYKEGKHGIRIENLIYVTEDCQTEFGTFLKFQTLTLCPYERKLIDTALLTQEEIDQINEYHKRVFAELSPLIDASAQSWLQKATEPLFL